MFGGSFLAGLIPLSMNLAEERLKLVSTCGAGILVGTALIVIIPEGVETVYDSSTASVATESHSRRSTDDNYKEYIGVALISGFALMFIVDQITVQTGSHSHSRVAVSVTELRDLASPEQHNASKTTASATLGLMVHAAADGIALGAASASDSNTSIGFIVFVAIMLHKAPSAFALSSFLLQEKQPRRSIRNHLLAFSAAAPSCALLTYAVIMYAGSARQTMTAAWTGLLLLFSAGTFLYVSCVHILPEVYSTHYNHDHSHDKMLSHPQIICLLLGFFCPLLLSFEVSF